MSLTRVPVFCILLAFWSATPILLIASEKKSHLSPDQAIMKLKEGNARYCSGKSTHPRSDAARRAKTATGQQPFATVIGCSDSRVPVGTLFDQGIGDLFVVRVAGPVCGVNEMGSIEYGVHHLATPVMVVLGHTDCGAVTAVVTGVELHGNVLALVENIRPAAAAAKKANPTLHGKALVSAATKANVRQSIHDLLSGSPVTRKRVKAGTLKVVGALYDLKTGKVEWLGEHPQQKELLGNP